MELKVSYLSNQQVGSSIEQTHTANPVCKACLQPLRDRSHILLLNRNHTFDSAHSHNLVRTENSKTKDLKNFTFNFKNPQSDHSEESRPIDLELYHCQCLSCFLCGDQLSVVDQRCWKYKGHKVTCATCRTRMTHCGRCQLKITEDSWVHRLDKIPFHVACFTCYQCGRQLRQGDKVGLFGGDLFCLEHYLDKFESSRRDHPETRPDSSTGYGQGNGREEKLQQLLMNSGSLSHRDSDREPRERGMSTKSKSEEGSTKDMKQSIGQTNADVNCTTPCKPTFNTPSTAIINPINHLNNFAIPAAFQQQAQPHQPNLNLNHLIPNLTPGEQIMDSDCNWYYADDSGFPDETAISSCADISVSASGDAGHSVDSSASSNCSIHSKSKRIRTSFTPDQLAILQANFDVEANPDGQELERIANMAKLNKRVTQVWFQNARARKKKIECRSIGPSNHLSFTSPSCCLSDSNLILEDEFEPSDNPDSTSQSDLSLCKSFSCPEYEKKFGTKMAYFNEFENSSSQRDPFTRLDIPGLDAVKNGPDKLGFQNVDLLAGMNSDCHCKIIESLVYEDNFDAFFVPHDGFGPAGDSSG